MAPVPEPAFRDLLADRSRTAFADFLAALWRARGRAVTREGDLVVVDGERVLVPVAEQANAVDYEAVDVPSSLERVPVCTTATDAEDAIGPDELRQLLLYGVPRDRATELFEEHFDRALDGDWPGATRDVVPRGAPEARTPATGGRGTHGADRSTGGVDAPVSASDTEDVAGAPGVTAWLRRVMPGRSGITTVVLLLVLLVGLAVTAPIVPPADGWLGAESAFLAPDGTPESDAGGDAVDAATSSPTGEDGAGSYTDSDADPNFGGGEVVVSSRSTVGDYPPGVGSGGVHDAGVLADAHLDGTTGRSYELTITYREYREGAPTGTVREWVRVDEPTEYVSRIERTGVVIAEPRAVSGNDTYADGALRYERRIRSAQYVYSVRDARAFDAGRTFGDRVAGQVRTYLTAPETRIIGSTSRNGVTVHLVMFRGEAWVGSARIDERGVVHELRWRFTPSDHPRVTAEVVVRYDFGPVPVTEPDWVADARNVTWDRESGQPDHRHAGP